MNQQYTTAAGVPRLLKPEEAADVLQVSAKTLWTLTKAEHVPAIRVGAQWRYDLADLLAWIQQRKTGHRAGTGA